MKTKDFGHKVPDEAYCGGYTDEHGHWNNGFSCPMWAGPDKEYCCGPDTHRHCCVEQEQQTESENTSTYIKSHVPLLVSVFVSVAVLCLILVLLSCLFCRCCCLYRRRKQRKFNREFEDMRGQEMNRYLSNEFVLIPGQGTFSPDILEGSEHSSQKALCPKELHLRREAPYNINEAYSSSNVSDSTLVGRAMSIRSSVYAESVGAPASVRSSIYAGSESSQRDSLCRALQRDSGCFVTPLDNEHSSGVRSLFPTLDRNNLYQSYSHSEEAAEMLDPCQKADESSTTGLLHNYEEICDSELESSEDNLNSSNNNAVSEVPCCNRNNDPHTHSKV